MSVDEAEVLNPSPPSPTPVEHVDVIVVGAGLSGIGAAYRLQTECPDRSYVVLESRDAIGGTWDLFRYPGVRSDSDMFTLSYPFQPWTGEDSIADGGAILDYIRKTATDFGIDRRIRFRTRVIAADFDTASARWIVTVEIRDDHGPGSRQPPQAGAQRRTLTCDFLYTCAGYYDYDTTYTPTFPGIEDFAGEVVHPQFWPSDLDHTGRRVVVIGSGATAVTLVPAMAPAAASVTMLQRSPSWITAVRRRDRRADAIRARLPAGAAHRVVRAKNILFGTAFYTFCRRSPARAGAFLIGTATRILGDPELVAQHFTPTYDVWDQRLCAAPGADIFTAIRRGDAEVVTDTIETFVPSGIRLTSGRVLEADLVVTATGLQLLAFGGIAPSVDQVPVALDEQFVWRGAMVTSIPNFAVCVGYTNASWTLRADLTSRLVTKVLTYMDDRDLAAVVPVPDRPLTERPLLELASGYVRRSIAAFPRQGDRGEWRVRQNYLLDAATTLRTGFRRTLRGTPRAALRPGSPPS